MYFRSGNIKVLSIISNCLDAVILLPSHSQCVSEIANERKDNFRQTQRAAHVHQSHCEKNRLALISV
jgi:hypothetical protein